MTTTATVFRYVANEQACLQVTKIVQQTQATVVQELEFYECLEWQKNHEF